MARANPDPNRRGDAEATIMTDSAAAARPLFQCDHDLVSSEYRECRDGQHEVKICEQCGAMIADLGHPDPSNVVE